MRYLKKYNESLDNDIIELIYTMEDIFVDLKDMGCGVRVYPDPENDKDDFKRLVNYLSDKLDFSDPPFCIQIKDGRFYDYKKKALACLQTLKRTLEPWGLYVNSAKFESSPNYSHPFVNEPATIIRITKI
jgi:hypothetical protein